MSSQNFLEKHMAFIFVQCFFLQCWTQTLTVNIYDIGDEDLHYTHIHRDTLKTHRAWYGYGIIFCVDLSKSKWSKMENST